jgi:hypothetical protein
MPAGFTPERILQHQQTAEIREAKARGSKIREAATFAEDRHENLDASNLSDERLHREKCLLDYFCLSSSGILLRKLCGHNFFGCFDGLLQTQIRRVQNDRIGCRLER